MADRDRVGRCLRHHRTADCGCNPRQEDGAVCPAAGYRVSAEALQQRRQYRGAASSFTEYIAAAADDDGRTRSAGTRGRKRHYFEAARTARSSAVRDEEVQL